MLLLETSAEFGLAKAAMRSHILKRPFRSSDPGSLDFARDDTKSISFKSANLI